MGASAGASAAILGLQLQGKVKASPPLPRPDTEPGLSIKHGTPAAVEALRQGSGSRGGFGTAAQAPLLKQGSQTRIGPGWLQIGRRQCSGTAEQLGHASSCAWDCLGAVLTGSSCNAARPTQSVLCLLWDTKQEERATMARAGYQLVTLVLH